MSSNQKTNTNTTITIHTNEDLRTYVKNAIKESGMKKEAVADKLGYSRQGFYNSLMKKSFSLDDANKVLQAIHYPELIITERKET